MTRSLVWFSVCLVALGWAWLGASAGASAAPADVPVPNSSFEEALQGGMPPGWPTLFGGATFGKEISLSDNRAVAGKYSIRIEDRDAKAGIGLRSAPLPATPGSLYVATVQVYNEQGTAQLYLEFWDRDGKRIGVQFAGNGTAGAWTAVAVQGSAPEGATALTLLLYSHGANTGVSFYDEVRLGRMESEAAFEGTRLGTDRVRELKRPDVKATLAAGFTAAVQDHPRLYFTRQELAALRAQLEGSDPAAAGLRAIARDLIAAARGYVTERSFTVTYYGGHPVTFPLPPRQPDPIPDPPGFTAGRYPYWTGMSRAIQSRLETLALAYALTGEREFGERAKELALALADWREWTDTTYPCGGNTCLDTAHFTAGVAAVYDMVHDLLSPEERARLRLALLEKGLRFLYADTNQKADHNLHMLRTSGLGAGALVLLGEADTSGYVARAFENFFWYLDQRLDSGQTEGLLYTSYAMDYVARFADALQRVTGNRDFLAHPYVQRVLPQWAAYFLAPGGRGLVNFSDSSIASYFFITMSLLSNRRGDSLAAWYLRTADFGADNWARLLFRPSFAAAQSPDALGLPPSRAFWDIGWVALRSGWEPGDHLLAFQSSGSRLGHNQRDQNHLVLNVGGDWLITDPGYPDYSPGPKNDVTKGTIGHNALLVDGHGQAALGTGRLLEFFHSPAYDFTTGEAGAGYVAYGLQGWERKILYSRPDYFVVTDRVSAFRPVGVEFLFHTDAQGRMLVGGTPRRVGEQTADRRFRIEKGSSTVDGYVVYPEAVMLTYSVVKGAEEFGPFVRVAPPQPVSEAVFVTALRPAVAGSETPPFDVRARATEGAVVIEARIGAETEYTLLNPARRPGVQGEPGGPVAAAGDHAIVRVREGTPVAYSLANGTLLQGPQGLMLVEADQPVSVGFQHGQEGGMSGVVWAARPGQVRLWTPGARTVAVNGKELAARDFSWDAPAGLVTISIGAGESRIAVRR